MDLILHIGTEKTGSTTIQYALAARRDALLEEGILYPRLFGSENHMEIAVASMGYRSYDTVQIEELARTGMDLPTYEAALREQLNKEIRAAGPRTLLISNEHCHGRLSRREDVLRLVKLLGAPFDNVKVIVYLRRQDRMAVSQHSSRLRGGVMDEMLPTYGPKPPAYYDFHHLMSLYADVFGAEALVPRLFERDRLIGGDVVHDFFEIAGLPVSVPSVPKENLALSRQQARFLTLFNPLYPLLINDQLNPARGPIINAIYRTLPDGPSAKPARAAAEAFQRQFDEVNKLARDQFMPDLDRPSLFDDSFDDYPEIDDTDIPLTEAEMMQFVQGIWRQVMLVKK